MQLDGAHLTYCTNIHPGESWADVWANLERHVVAVKARIAPTRPFGVGLRLSARAAAGLALEVDEVRRRLADLGLYVFTINGFPYGTFHGTAVKEAVYRPDWREPARIAYTNQLADLLAALLPDGITGSISTVPGCFRARGAADAEIASNLARCTDYLGALEERTGKRIMLALEPEPACAIETLAEAAAFFADHDPDRRYLGVCLDACHAAVEFEQLDAALAALAAARAPIAKIQLSAGLQVAPVDERARAALARYADDVYLHQVVARRGAALVRYVDLPDALADRAPADEWRVHFHVPIFRTELGAFASTQAFLAELLARHARAPIAPHLEVETYTWDVLPPELRDQPIAEAIARELAWVRERLCQ